MFAVIVAYVDRLPGRLKKHLVGTKLNAHSLNAPENVGIWTLFSCVKSLLLRQRFALVARDNRRENRKRSFIPLGFFRDPWIFF